jgi:hypothetical protein
MPGEGKTPGSHFNLLEASLARHAALDDGKPAAAVQTARRAPGHPSGVLRGNVIISPAPAPRHGIERVRFVLYKQFLPANWSAGRCRNTGARSA